MRRRGWVLAARYQSALASHDVVVARVGLVRCLLLRPIAYLPLLGALGARPSSRLSCLLPLLCQSLPLLLAGFRLLGQALLLPSLLLSLLLQLCLLVLDLLLLPLELSLLSLDLGLSTRHLALEVCKLLGLLTDLFARRDGLELA